MLNNLLLLFFLKLVGVDVSPLASSCRSSPSTVSPFDYSMPLYENDAYSSNFMSILLRNLAQLQNCRALTGSCLGLLLFAQLRNPSLFSFDCWVFFYTIYCCFRGSNSFKLLGLLMTNLFKSQVDLFSTSQLLSRSQTIMSLRRPQPI